MVLFEFMLTFTHFSWLFPQLHICYHFILDQSSDAEMSQKTKTKKAQEN